MLFRAWHLAWLAVLFAGPATAGSLRVDPVQVLISNDRKSAAVTVINRAVAPVTLRAYPLAWTQSDGQDAYSETSAVIVSPRVVTIQPGATQLVRVGFRKPAAAQGAWRLILEEVPQPAPEEAGVQVALRMNLPVFARLKAGKPGDIRWSSWRSEDGGWTVEAFNPTGSYVRLASTDFTASTGIHYDSSLRVGVVLPNSRRRWRLSARPTLIDAVQFNRIARAGGSDDRVAVFSPRN